MRKGELTFNLHGQRLNGRFHLVRLRPKPNQRSRQDNWLLFKGHDEAEQAGANAATLESASDPPEPATPRRKPARTRKKATSTERPAAGAKRGKLPARQTPQLCAIAEEPPDGDDWISEIKFDGYRLLAWLDHGKVRLVTRNGHDWTDRLPAVARAVAGLDCRNPPCSMASWSRWMQTASPVFPLCRRHCPPARTPRSSTILFDLLHLDGWDLRACASAGSQGRVAEDRRLARHAALQRSPRRRCRGDATRGVPHETGRHHLQAGRCAVPRRPRPRLAESEMPGPRGIHRAWVDAAARQPHGARRAASRLLRHGPPPALCRRRRHRIFRRRTRRHCATGWTPLPPIHRAACSSPAIRWTSPSTGCGRNWSRKPSMCRGPVPAASGIRCISACARTSRPRTWCITSLIPRRSVMP